MVSGPTELPLGFLARLAVISDTDPLTTARLTRMLVAHDPGVFAVRRRSPPHALRRVVAVGARLRRAVGVPLKDNVIAVPGNHDFDARTGHGGVQRRFEPMWPRHVFREGGAPGSSPMPGTCGSSAWTPGRSPTASRTSSWSGSRASTREGPATGHRPGPQSAGGGEPPHRKVPGPRPRPARPAGGCPCTAWACACTCAATSTCTPTGSSLRPTAGRPIHQLTVGGGGATSYQVMTPDVVHR